MEEIAMDSAVKAVSEVAKGDPVYVLAVALVTLITLVAFAVRSILNALFREPKSSTDKGGLAIQVKDAFIDFVKDVKEKNEKTHDSVNLQRERLDELHGEVQAIRRDMPAVCRAAPQQHVPRPIPGG